MRYIRTIALLTVIVLAAAALSGCASGDSAVVMKLGGFDVRYDVFRFAVLTERSALEAKYGEDVFSESGSVSDEIREEFRDGTVANLKNMYAALALAADRGISADDPAVADSANKMRTDAVNAAGSESEFLAALSESGMTEYVFSFMSEAKAAGEEVYYAMLNSGEIVSDEESVRTFLESDECVRVRQILVTTENRTDEHARELAEEARALAEGGEDFDELISRYGEDMNMFGSSQGYYLMRGVMYPEFESAAFALGEGEISEVIKSPAGYSVIKRLEKDAEYIKTHFDQLSEDYCEAQFSLACEAREDALEITDSEAFDKIDILSIN